MWGKLASLHAPEIKNAVRSDHYTFEIISAPEHSVDHVVCCELHQSGVFSGDRFRGPRINYSRRDDNIRATIRSLTLLHALNSSKFFTVIFSANHCGAKRS